MYCWPLSEFFTTTDFILQFQDGTPFTRDNRLSSLTRREIPRGGGSTYERTGQAVKALSPLIHISQVLLKYNINFQRPWHTLSLFRIHNVQRTKLCIYLYILWSVPNFSGLAHYETGECARAQGREWGGGGGGCFFCLGEWIFLR